MMQPGRETPTRKETLQRLIYQCSRRHIVRPGVAGQAGRNGIRGKAEPLEKAQRRFQYDVFYVDNCSFILDLEIIMITLFLKGHT